MRIVSKVAQIQELTAVMKRDKVELKEQQVSSILDMVRKLPLKQAGGVFRQYDVVARMDYPEHDIFLRVSSEHIANRVRAATKEPFTVRWIMDYIRPGDVFYDIGANVGSYSLIAAKHFGCGIQIYALEPSYNTFVDLNWNIHYNSCAGCIITLPVALSSRNALGRLVLSSEAAGAAIHTLAAIDVPTEQRSDSVLKITLDTLVRNFGLPIPNHLKIDVDGSEIDILLGAKDTLQHSDCRSMIMEMNRDVDGVSSSAPIRRLLKKMGFHVASIHNRRNGAAPPYYVFSKSY